MAASRSQGSCFGLFLVGATLLSIGVATIATGVGKLLLLAGAVVVLAAAVGFFKIKPLEGVTPVAPSPESMKWIGAGVAALGWVVTLGGVRAVESNGGRIVVALIGIGVSLFGILYVLPAAFNKTAFWKKPAGASGRPGVSALSGRSTVESELSATPTAMGMTK